MNPRVRIVSLTNCDGKLERYIERNMPPPLPHTLVVDMKWLIDLNIKAKTVKLLEKKISEEYLRDLTCMTISQMTDIHT